MLYHGGYIEQAGDVPREDVLNNVIPIAVIQGNFDASLRLFCWGLCDEVTSHSMSFLTRQPASRKH